MSVLNPKLKTTTIMDQPENRATPKDDANRLSRVGTAK